MDIETDPFKEGRRVQPFSLGFFDGINYKDFWGLDCVHRFFDWLKITYDEPLLIYAHNGGGFDFFFMLDYMDDGCEPIIIHGKLTKVSFAGQEFRDSFKIIPAPLSAYQKDSIDYTWFEHSVRQSYRAEILHYLRKDCEYLFTLVTRYHDMFGDELTIGSTSINYLQHFYGFEKLRPDQDDTFRPFYFGGRNQCFESGTLYSSKKWRVYDVNSMYPHAMRSFQHPIGARYEVGRSITEDTFFIEFEGKNYGALPIRAEDNSLDFTTSKGVYLCTIHEFNTGLETGTISVDRINLTYDFPDHTDFSQFIDYFYEMRLEAKSRSDKVEDLFYKLLMNNSYGKFAQDPRKYSDYLFTIGQVPDVEFKGDNENDPEAGYELDSSYGEGFMWKRQAKNRYRGFRNVATAASITGASRSELLVGISKADRPIYCDTDSIVCEALHADLNETKLGAWKLEASADLACVAGKKLYALFDGNECVKSASKGAKLNPEEIRRIAGGDKVIYSNPVPHFKLDGSVEFITRTIGRTA